MKYYHRAILHLSGIIDKSSAFSMYSKKLANDDVSKQISEIKFSIYLNMSQIYIYEAKYDKGLEV